MESPDSNSAVRNEPDADDEDADLGMSAGEGKPDHGNDGDDDQLDRHPGVGCGKHQVVEHEETKSIGCPTLRRAAERII